MEKIVDATYDGEVVRFDEPVDVAPNTKVRVLIDDENDDGDFELVFAKKKNVGKPYAWLEFARNANLKGPSDFSTNLDDYLYHGKPIPDED